MSVRVAEEVMRWALRLYSRRPQWTQLMTSGVQHTTRPRQLAHVLGTRQSLVGSARFHSQSSIHNEDLKDKDVPSSLGRLSLPGNTTLKEVSPFTAKLQDCRSPSDVLDLTCQYAPTVQEISKCLNRMWVTSKKLSFEQRHYEIQLMFENPAFDKLLQMTKKNVGYMQCDSVAFCLLSILKLGVPQQSLVVRTLIQACQENLNNFDEKSLSILATSLDQMDNSPDVSALKKAMGLIFEHRLPSIKRVISLQTMMRMLGKNAPLHLKKKFEKKALSMIDSFTLPNTQYMISTMAAVDLYSKPLLEICNKKITENINVIPTGRLLSLLYSYKDLQCRDLDLLTSISDYAASTLDIWTNKQVCLFLSVFESLVFCPAAFMEAYAKKVISCPDFLTLKDLLCVLKVYSFLNYDLQQNRQQFLDSLSQVVESYLPKMSGIMLLKCVYYLSLMGHFPSAPLEQLLQSSTIEQIETSPTLQKDEKMFRIVDLCLRLDRPPLPRPLTVPPSVLGASPTSSVDNQLLSQMLHSVFKDEADTVLQEMVMVENFYLIDGLITKRLPAQTSVTEASGCDGGELSPAESSQRTAVIYAPNSAFCYGSTNPRGFLAVKIRHLKILGYNPVLVSERELKEEKSAEIISRLIFPERHRSEMDQLQS